MPSVRACTLLPSTSVTGGLRITRSPALNPASTSTRVPKSRATLTLGLVAFCVVLGEGAMADWTAIYLDGTLRAGAGLAILQDRLAHSVVLEPFLKVANGDDDVLIGLLFRLGHQGILAHFCLRANLRTRAA